MSMIRHNLLLAVVLIAAALCPSLFVAVAAAEASDSGPDLPSGFVHLRDIAPDIIEDMRYASLNNFTGRVLPGYEAAACVLRREAAQALAMAQRLARADGYRLMVFDCYRPARAVAAFADWARNPGDDSARDYHPRLPKSLLYGKGYIASRSDHSRGIAVDLTLVKPPRAPVRTFDPRAPRAACTAPLRTRPADDGIDMGTGFDCFDTLSHTDDPRIDGKAHANRQLLKSIMRRAGFANYRREWWHYSYVERHYPKVYYDFPIAPYHK